MSRSNEPRSRDASAGLVADQPDLPRLDLLATLSLGFAFYFVNARVSAEAEDELRRGLTEAATLVDLLARTSPRRSRRSRDSSPTFPTSRPPWRRGRPNRPTAADQVPRELARRCARLTDPGRGAGGIGRRRRHGAHFRAAPLHRRGLHVSPASARLLHGPSVPIFSARPDQAQTLGRLTVGLFMDDRLAARFKGMTGSEIAFAADGADPRFIVAAEAARRRAAR